MKNSRKELITQIQLIATSLENQRNRVTIHKRNFLDIINDRRVELVALLLPPFLLGWYQGSRGFKGGIVNILKTAILSVFTVMKKRLLPILAH